MADHDLNEYARALVADIQAKAEAEDGSIPNTFTRHVLDILEEAGVASDTTLAYYSARGLEIYGYGVSEDGSHLDLFTTDFHLAQGESKMIKAESEKLFRRLAAFLRKHETVRQSQEDNTDVHDMCVGVEKAMQEVSRIRLFVLCNRVSTADAPESTEFEGIPVTHELWDLARLHRHETSGTVAEPIKVTFDQPLPCLAAHSDEPNYSVVLAVISGRKLAELYEEHRTRLLELNVRSFLQTRGAVNKGIRDTLLHAPGRFLAYNNGVTATASDVDFIVDGEGNPIAIKSMTGLQIVNGGQTTASLHHVLSRDKRDLDGVHVQMKLTIVEPAHLSEIVPKISQYSNTQNKVTLVDFSSNHDFHIDFERVSRTLWAPAPDGSSQETRWFYERARGQYADESAKHHTPASQRKFKLVMPTRQRFSKSDLATYVHSWEQLPHWVSRGAQKNFAHFMERIDRSGPIVDARYCKRVIATALLFQTADKVARMHAAGSHKRLITTYMVARLALATERRIDLDRIWNMQSTTEALEEALDDLCPHVMKAVIVSGRHVSEWAKKPDSWDVVSRTHWEVPDSLKAELLDAPIVLASPEEEGSDEAEVLVTGIASETWKAIGDWAHEGGGLRPAERQLADRVARRLEQGQGVTGAQARRAYEVYEAAIKLGFHVDGELRDDQQL
ncbi:AIPR family protein [Streptomyces sp. NRRL S-495]|uniref:AIPR family protein n=1 Tax=Streptomyces sp. NRRL S-495 TaxID=1609133 RepID=UPI0005F8D682|nr:AIPR family protein [Streptomyces sp. NRRL S-495]KJY36950.1 abortive phage resistance protein [Streptomyces sp. NRRL S-495]